MPRGVPTESATENIPPEFARVLVRVKRWCKRPPLEAQVTRHGKPHRVQGQIGDPGAARSGPRKRTGPGYWLLRQMILSARKSADKIRLTALPRPLFFVQQNSFVGWISPDLHNTWRADVSGAVDGRQ